MDKLICGGRKYRRASYFSPVSMLKVQMKSATFLLALFAAALPSSAQIELISENYFPADLEFEELDRVTSEKSFSDVEQMSHIENGGLITDVGFENYDQRTYALKDSGSLFIEIITLLDYRASYSLLTLLHNSEIKDGPPGDAFASEPGQVLFCHGKTWVRIRGQEVSDSLLHRIALSVSNRLGQPDQKFPSLISYLPAAHMQLPSLEYFPGSKSFRSFTESGYADLPRTDYEMEIARAQYFPGNKSSALSLLKFPTPQIAEEYYSEISRDFSTGNRNKTYLRRSGPLVCILQGSIGTENAIDILGSIQYSYSVKWIYDQKAQSNTVWRIPAVILRTTVWSFFLVIVFCMFAILAGAGLAGIRLLVRYLFPKNPLDDPKRTEITRLKLS